ncbi:MAG: hypothetical protein LBO09_03950 [Candidatus Peribacteria bacterium]|jgi:hypothetical protein|nr:hypothetical protein [Candidatus Peribacteria bacterium]
METGIGATLEKRNPLFAQQVVPFSENALENLDTPLSIGHIFGFLHHGEVESNKIFLASSSKDNQESLNKRGEGQIIAQAYERKKL